MRHFLDIDLLSNHEILELVDRAQFFKTQNIPYPNYSKYNLATLFYEHSTRTKISFELAAKNLNLKVINFDANNSSEAKGEIIEDTLNTLCAMGIQLFVIRHQQDHLPWLLSKKFTNKISILNAGDGMNAHPSQAMLDLMTILEHKKNLENLKIVVVGNIKHSRVAKSFEILCEKLNIGELVFVAPDLWLPEHTKYASVHTSLADGLKDADVVICLRVQRERLLAHEGLDLSNYHNNYGVNTQKLKYAKLDAIVMHPGPINRGIEITSEVADGSSSCILEQVRNGVFMRMAIIEYLIQHLNT